MTYAEVAVNSPIANRQSYSYSIPSRLSLDIGQAVWVPFGPRMLQGIIIKLTDQSAVELAKDIIDIISTSPLLSHAQVELGIWLSNYYLAPLFDSIALMLPPGFERRIVGSISLSESPIKKDELSLEHLQIIDFIREHKQVNIAELNKQFGKNKVGKIVKQLLSSNILIKTEKLENIKVKPKTVPHIGLVIDNDKIIFHIEQLKKTRAHSQANVLELLSKQTGPVPLPVLREKMLCNSTVIEALRKKHLVYIEDIVFRRTPRVLMQDNFLSPVVLTAAQEQALLTLKKEHDDGIKPHVFLLRGVTGSGKTEIYIRAMAETISRGRKGICLVPEIALTRQTIERFTARFPGRVAAFHSRLSLGEQYDEWHRIKRGECDVVIGTRSALFTPQANLGIIIIDEEHEWTYKQTDQSPRYHTRETAIKLASLNGATVILGSATPDVETFYKATQGEYTLIELGERITPRGITPLPEVRVINVCNELKTGNMGLFSRSLAGAVRDALSMNSQVLLFLNRRGTANFIQCHKCGYVPACKRCSLALTYHSVENKLICHHCHYSSRIPQTCVHCGASKFRLLGIGTQKVEEEAKRLFPAARVLRLDSDTSASLRMDDDILNKFRNHEADILIGTQMIAKGLDLPLVTLTGIINADTGLNFPDFRAGERTFQLLCQVSGRSGRGLYTGNAIIQTYNPDHYAVKAASTHDYIGFYQQEIKYRNQFGYPPFGRMVRLVFSHSNADICRREAERVGKLIAEERDKQKIPDNKIIGPVPSYIVKSRGLYQWQIIICGTSIEKLLANIPIPRGWVLDIDPVSVI
jgi:primosomal protein N' (replication factor Y)